MSSSAARKIEDKPAAGDMDLAERAELRALIAESDAAHARGETVPFDALLDVIDRVSAER